MMVDSAKKQKMTDIIMLDSDITQHNFMNKNNISSSNISTLNIKMADLWWLSFSQNMIRFVSNRHASYINLKVTT